MNLTQFIKQVLDEAYAGIPGDESTKDASIKSELSGLSFAYTKLGDENSPAIDYSNPLKRFAYIFRYTIAHADYIRQIISGSPTLGKKLLAETCEVACLGGGPGSDFLGILKYMIRQGVQSKSLTCYIFDKERAWGDSWSDVARTLDAPFKIFPVFQQLDVTEKSSWVSYEKFLRSDIFTLSYFVSEIWRIKDQAQPFFDHCFAGMKSGATLLFIDNQDKAFYAWIDELAARHSFIRETSTVGEIAFEVSEEKTDLEPYYSKFGWLKRKGSVAIRVLRKP